MFYFVNTGFAKGMSGVEHAQLKRLALFNRFNTEAKIVTQNFSLDLHKVMRSVGVDDNQVVNLFDYFQGSTSFMQNHVGIEDLHFGLGLELLINDQDENGYMVRNSERIIQRIKMRSPEYDEVESITTYDAYQNISKTQHYDTRGFMSLEQIYNAAGSIVVEKVYSPTGSLVYQTFHGEATHNEVDNTLYMLIGYRGRNYTFNGQAELTRFFLDELNSKNLGNNIFVVDRTFELAWSVLNMHSDAHKYMHIHSNHLNNPNDILNSSLNFNYTYALNNIEKWDGVITPTEKQKDDLVARWGQNTPIYAIPVGSVPESVMNSPRIPIAERTHGNVTMVARLSPEKQQEQAINAFEIVHKLLPDVTLTFWGYSNGDEENRLKGLVRDKKLEKVIAFQNYTEDVSTVFDNSVLHLLTSSAEGFALVLMEAQSHGVPNVAYRVNYGPNDIINDQVDGALVELNDVESLAVSIVNLLQNPTVLQRYSDNSYKNANRYSQETTFQSWKEIIKEGAK